MKSQILASGNDDGTIKLWYLPELELESLLTKNCDVVRSYLKNNPNVNDEDRNLCDGIGDFSDRIY
ncbi:MAG: hypothetical protein EAZ76_04170 [Nostocales cyanobacterium]|nr:MAG: hypothetical protein EAZ87_18330 [Nostocales cyanobacterium]TAF18916.1 MAG: hypothetical protein EAZ76_04170 [Nostocales cyanobacterium]